MAFDGFRRELREFRESRPGTRFERGHERQRADNRLLRWTLIAFGISMVFGGALTFWVPGPNFVVVVAGLALVATQWRFVARRLDALEVVARRWNEEHWDPYPHKRRVIAIAWIVVATIVALAIWFAARQGWLPDWVPFAVELEQYWA